MVSSYGRYAQQRGRAPARSRRLSAVTWGALVATALAFGRPGLARAGSDGFFVTYTSFIEEGEIELMLMNDFTQPSQIRRNEDGRGDYLSHMVELELAPTAWYSTELMVEWFEDLSTGDAAFTGFRWENRFRLYPEDIPLNPMVYLEYEDLDPRTRYKMETSGWVVPPYDEEPEEEPAREHILESRLVLSQQAGPVRVAFNWINETDITSGYTAFGYSLGAIGMIHFGDDDAAETAGVTYGCPMHTNVAAAEPGDCPHCGMELSRRNSGDEHEADHDEEREHGGRMLGLGLEAYGGLGDSKEFGIDFSRQEHYLGPIAMLHPAEHWMIHTQLAIGLSNASDDLVRFNVGYEF